MLVLVLGPSGCGKDTQIGKYIENKNIITISTGDLFRNEIENKTQIGRLIKNKINKGYWIDNDIWSKVIFKWLKEVDKTKEIILNAFVREKTQTELLDEILNMNNLKIDKVIVFEVDNNKIIERITGRYLCPKCKVEYHTKYKRPKVDGFCDFDGMPLIQRDDDTKNSIHRRLKNYYDNIYDIKKYYNKKGILYEIDGNGTIDEVFKSFKQVMSK